MPPTWKVAAKTTWTQHKEELWLSTDKAEDPIMAVWRASRALGEDCIMQNHPHAHPKCAATLKWKQPKNISTPKCHMQNNFTACALPLQVYQHEQQPPKLTPPGQLLSAAVTTCLHQDKVPINLVGVLPGLQQCSQGAE